MKAGRFINKYMAALLRRPEIKNHLDASRNRKRDLATLSELLQLSYHRYLKEYHQRQGLGTWLAELLRVAGLGADLAGTYLFWSTGIGMGMGFKFAGFCSKSLADLIATARYRRHVGRLREKKISPAGFSLFGEIVAVRLLAWLPWGIFEILDFVRGRWKYSHALHRMAARQAVKAFLISRSDGARQK